MICDGNCGLSPLISSFYQHSGVRNSIHITHLRMAVQFHSLHRGVIASSLTKIPDSLNSPYRRDRQIPVKGVNRRLAFNFQEGTFCKFWFQVRHLIVFHKDLHGNRICKIRYLKDENCAFISDFSHIEGLYLPADHNITDLVFDGDDVYTVLVKVSSVDHIRIRRPIYSAGILTGMSFQVLPGSLCLLFHLYTHIRGLFLMSGLDFFSDLRMCNDIFHLLYQPKLTFLSGSTHLRLFISCMYLQVKAAALAKHLLQNLQQLFLPFMGDHRINQ